MAYLRGAVLLCLIAAVGCSSKGPKPGVTYTATIISRTADGKLTTQGPTTRVESAVVKDVKEISYDGHALVLSIRKTEFERATFDVTFPDQTAQTVRVKVGESKDVLQTGQTLGVRIEVQMCR